MDEGMKKLLVVLLISTTNVPAMAQQWWAPGACWIYQEQLLSQALHIYMYRGDTLIDGYPAQVCQYRYCDVLPPDTFCYSFIQGTICTRLDNDVVYALSGPGVIPLWDTLYYLGLPGDAWYPLGYDWNCAPLSKILITDTGHVVMDGVSLRTWDIAQLSANGLPMQDPPFGDTLRVVERLGGAPRSFPDFYCPPDVIDEERFFTLRHYSDWQISFGTGPSCDIALNSVDVSPARLLCTPNPGTDHIQFNNTSPINIVVRDALGGIIQTDQRLVASSPVNTEAWPQGTYFISVADEKGTRATLRWMKQ